MKRLTVLFLAVVVMMFASCSQGGVNVDIKELNKSMLAADSALPAMDTVDSYADNASELFSSLSDFDYGKVQSFFLSYASDGKGFEIAAVVLKDKADVDAFSETLEAHVQSRVKLYKNYAPEEVPRAEKAEIVKKENAVALIMCTDQENVKKVFKEAIK